MNSSAVAPGSIATDVEGLHRVHGTENPNRVADIVFVHGLAGGARSTWEYGTQGKPDYFFWPIELGKDLPDCGVWTLGYEAGVIPWFGADGMPIEDRAINLAHKMTTRGLGDRPVIFVSHSMGGLMIKEIVVQSITAGDPDWRRLVSNIAGIVFCGTPHRGSDVASMAKKLAVILRTQNHIRDMAAGVRHLELLHTRFVEWQGNTNVPIEAYAERLGMTRESVWLRWLTKVLIVPPGSADPQIRGCRCIPCNNHHRGLVKPSNREHDVYSGVLKFIKECLASPARRPSAAPKSELPIVTSGRNSLHQLPPIPTGFIGREDDLETLQGGSPSDGALLTGLRGMGGIGKTALALVLAHKWSARFPDAQLLLDGQGTRQEPPPPTAESLIAQVIQAFRPTEKLPDELSALKSIYHELLQGKNVLILLDNARDAAQATPLIPPLGSAFIVTSRQSFMLGTVKPHNVGRLPDDEAAALLREYYADLSDANAEALIRLCAGLPLALRIAGAHVGLDASERGGIPDIFGYLQALGSGRLRNLDSDALDAGEITISETLRLSENQLSSIERDAWRKLGIFTASFELTAAQHVAGADLEMLGRFVRRSLLEREGTDRYKLHDLAGDYVRSKLTEAELTEVNMAHAEYYVKIADECSDTYLQGAARKGLELFDRERAQIEAAFAWLANRQDAVSANVLLRLVNAAVHTGALRFRPRQMIAWTEAQLAAARVVGDRDVEGNALGNLGAAYGVLGDARKATEYLEQRLRIARARNDRRGEGTSLNNLGLVYRMLKNDRKAIEFHEQALAIAREVGNRRGEGDALGNLGLAHSALGDVHKAIELHEQALAISRQIGDPRAEGADLGNLANEYAKLGNAHKAIEFYEERLDLARKIDDKIGEANSLWNSAILYYVLENESEAVQRGQTALHIFESLEHPSAEIVRTELRRWVNT